MGRISQRIPELDGLRGIAIAVVVLFHARVDPPWMYAPFPFLHSLLGLGVNGVDLFFVLSGFLITGILLDTKGASNYFRSFYSRRALRIFPVYFLAVGAFFFIQLPWLHSHGHWLEISSHEQGWYWSFLMNWHDVTGHIFEPLGHFWSLGVEEQFYLFWPLLILLCPKRYFTTLCLCICAFSLSVRVAICTGNFVGAELISEWIHRSSITRLDTLAFGALVAILVRNKSWAQSARAWVSVAATASFGAYAVFWIVRDTRPVFCETVGYSVLAVGCACAVLVCVMGQGSNHLLCRLTRWSVLQSLGKYSYAIYVFHIAVKFAIMTTIDSHFEAIRATHISPLIFSLLVLVVCLMGGYLAGLTSWHLWEKHFLRLKERFSYQAPAAKAPMAKTFAAH